MTQRGKSDEGRLVGGGKEELRASLLKPYLLRLHAEQDEPEVQRVIARSGLSAAVLENETSWVSTLTARRTLSALEKSLGRDAIARRGAWMVHADNLGAYVRLLRAAQDPREGYQQFCDHAREITRVGSYALEVLGPRRVRVTYRPSDDEGGADRDELLALAREAELVALPRLWGYDDAEFVRETPPGKDDGVATYVLSWGEKPSSRAALPGGIAVGLLVGGAPVALAGGGGVGSALAAVVGAGLGGVAGALWQRVEAERRARVFEKNRIAALERNLALRGDHGAEPAAPGELDGTILGGKYKILRRIGSGGIGVVYSAEHLGLGNTVAIKVLRGAAARDASEIARLRREAQVQGSIHHPNVVQTLDLDQLPDGSIYVVMELLHGRPLSERLTREGPLGPREAVPIFVQVCRALAAAHDKGVVHRDLKPGNIFLSDDGLAKVLDFGMSKFQAAESLTQDGYTLGTPEYMAPEQCIGAPVEPRTDLYAFGVLMYEALTGELPIQATDRRDLLDLHQRQIPQTMRARRPELPIPEALDLAVMACLRKRIGDRPRSAVDLEAMLSAVPIEGLPMSYPRRLWRAPANDARRAAAGGTELP